MTLLTLSICQIVGYKNSGKTTLINGLIKGLKDYGRSIATIKHHGHAEKDLLREGDSGQHIQSGSEVTSLVSPHFAHLSYASEPPLHAFVAFYQTFSQLDWLLIEGYKQAEFPKLVLVRNRKEWQDFSSLSNILAVLTDDAEVAQSIKGDFPLFSRQEVEKLVHFMLEFESRCER